MKSSWKSRGNEVFIEKLEAHEVVSSKLPNERQHFQ